MAFLKDLLNAGVDFTDAQVLESNYANEPEFIDGLEMVARALALNQAVGLIPPAGEPWRTFHQQMAHCSDQQQAFMGAIATMDSALQVAISGAVSTRMAQLQQYSQAQQVSPGKQRKSADYIKILKNLGYTFRFNRVRQAIEVNGNKIDNGLRKKIRGQVRDIGIREVGVVEDVYEADAHANAYHPIRDYFTNLKFDGGDPIGDVANHFVCEYGMFPVWLKRWMVGACAKVMQAEENRMLVLDGPQNIGKSHFVRWLASPLEEYFIEGGIDTNSGEDVYRRLAQRWIWEVSELGASTRKSDWEALKAFITMRSVTVRIKYDRDDTDLPALASLFGTINNEEGFMPVGDRRFYVDRVTEIDWNYKKIDVDQLWAQAFDLYINGEHWEPQGDERDEVKKINEEYRMLDLVEETVKSTFEIDTTKLDWQLSSLDIMETMKAFGLKSPGEVDARRLSRALTKLGLEKPKVIRVGNKTMRGYIGIRRRSP